MSLKLKNGTQSEWWFGVFFPSGEYFISVGINIDEKRDYCGKFHLEKENRANKKPSLYFFLVQHAEESDVCVCGKMGKKKENRNQMGTMIVIACYVVCSVDLFDLSLKTKRVIFETGKAKTNDTSSPYKVFISLYVYLHLIILIPVQKFVCCKRSVQ